MIVANSGPVPHQPQSGQRLIRLVPVSRTQSTSRTRSSAACSRPTSPAAAATGCGNRRKLDQTTPNRQPQDTAPVRIHWSCPSWSGCPPLLWTPCRHSDVAPSPDLYRRTGDAVQGCALRGGARHPAGQRLPVQAGHLLDRHVQRYPRGQALHLHRRQDRGFEQLSVFVSGFVSRFSSSFQQEKALPASAHPSSPPPSCVRGRIRRLGRPPRRLGGVDALFHPLLAAVAAVRCPTA